MLTHRFFMNISDGGCVSHDSVIKGYTEYCDDNGCLYQAHPNYKSGKDWNDWCLVRWDGIPDLVPAKIITLFDLSECDLMGRNDQDHLLHWLEDNGNRSTVHPVHVDRRTPYLTQDKWVVIQSAMTQDDHKRKQRRDGQRISRNKATYHLNSSISNRFFLESEYWILPVTTIVCLTYCVPIVWETSTTEYIHMEAKHEWACDFIPEGWINKKID